MRSARDTQLANLQTVLRALADPLRLRILALLGDGEVCVCHIHDTLQVPQPTASRHLAYLRRAGLVDARRDGQWVHYSLAKMPSDLLRTVTQTVTRCAGHVDTMTRDRKRLDKSISGNNPAGPASSRAGCR